MDELKLGERVIIVGKNVTGKIGYIGKTHFSEGEWFGLILDEAKGRNNGCIDGQCYFKCPRNYGLFVRKCQLQREETEDSEKNNNATKPVYPNYLRNSSPVKAKKLPAKKEKYSEISTSSKFQAHPMNAVVADLESLLKKQAGDFAKVKDQKTETEKKLKSKETELKRISKDLERLVRTQKGLKKELSNSQDEALVLKRKLIKAETNLNTSENKRRELEVKIEQLREITENAVIEKEIAEEKSEYFELIANDQTDKCKILEVEKGILKEEMQIQTIYGIPAIHHVKQLENKIAILNNALLKMRDLYQRLQQQVDDYKEAAQKHIEDIKIQKNIEKSLEETICTYRDEVGELYEVVDGMLSADEIVFEVIERNLQSEAKINRLYEALQYAEDKLQVGEEVEETLHELKSICTEEIECLKSKLRHTQSNLEQNVIALKNREGVIDKYRELTAVLRERNEKLSEDLENICKEKKEAVILVENLKLRIHRESRKNKNDFIAIENLKFDLERSQNELSYWSNFLPESFFKEEGENSAIKVRLLTEKMMKKVDLLLRFLESSIYKSYSVLKDEDLKYVSFVTKFIISACELHGFLKIFNLSFDYTDTNHFLALGKHHNIIAQTNNELDDFLNFISKDEIDKKICVENMKSIISVLSQFLDVTYAPKYEKTMVNTKSALQMIKVGCNYIFCTFLALGNSEAFPEDYEIHVKKFVKITEELKTNVDRIIKIVQDCKQENLCLHPVVEDTIKKPWTCIQRLMENTTSLYQTFDEDKQSNISDKKEKDTGSFEEINAGLMQVVSDVEELRKRLSNGDFFIEHVTKPQDSTSICTWAKLKKQERENVIVDLKHMLSSCEREIINLNDTLEIQKRQLANRLKSVTLKDESVQTEKNNYEKLFSNNVSHTSAMTECLKLKLHDMECSLKYVSQKNFQLRIAPMKTYHKFLEPLKILPKRKYNPETHSIYLLQKRLNEAAARLRRIILPTIVDITRKDVHIERKYKKFRLERFTIYNDVKEELCKIVVEVKRFKSSPRSIWSDTSNPFSLRSFPDEVNLK